jgi:hypothetical protein
MSEHIYYLAGPGSPALAVINEAISIREARMEIVEAFRKEIGADHLYVRGDGSGYFVGVAFSDSGAPEGWRFNGEYHVPNKRSKVGKAIARRLEQFPTGVDGFTFTSMLESATGHAYMVWKDNTCAWATFGVFQDKVILSVPAGTVPPEGCTELKVSEYYRIVEDAQAAANKKEEAA